MTVELAISPPAWPPIRRRRRAGEPGIPRVLVLGRTRPTSERGGVAEAIGTGCSGLDGRAADADLIAWGDPDELVALPLDEGAIGRAEVLDRPALIGAHERGMLAGGEVVIQDEQALGIATDENIVVAEGGFGCPRGGPR